MNTATEPRTEVFTMPWPVTANNAKMPVGNRMVTVETVREYYTLICLRWRGQIETMRGPYRVRMDIYEPNRRRRDIANLEKVINDSLVKAEIITDDCLIDDLHLVRHRGKLCKPDGKIVVTIREVTQ